MVGDKKMSKIQAVLRKHQYGSVTGIVVAILFSFVLANSTVASFPSPINVAIAGQFPNICNLSFYR